MPVFLCSFDVLFLVVSLRDKVRDGHGCEVKGASDVQYDKFHLFAKGRDYPSTEKKKKNPTKNKALCTDRYQRFPTGAWVDLPVLNLHAQNPLKRLRKCKGIDKRFSAT